MYFDENEPQAVRDARLAAQRAAAREARRTAVLDSGMAHVGAAIVAVALVLLGWFGKTVAVAVVGGMFAVWFCAALVWTYVDGDHGRHALQRAYNLTFGWADGL
ncbi:hypothetical protein [Streptomyces sp. NPDC057854]|uniref:hypothetical protein n=1 Tax=unclassified Streptomyces TaxID=2593676 RepID=UPI003699CFB3